MANKQIFRKVALDRLSSPEQLDQLMQVTTPYGWVALVGLSTLVIVALIWSCTALIPNEVASRGILARGGRIYTAVSTAAGQIGTMRVHAGDTVSAGQIIAHLTTLPAAGTTTAAIDVVSPLSGRVVEILADTGAICPADLFGLKEKETYEDSPVGQVLCMVPFPLRLFGSN